MNKKMKIAYRLSTGLLVFMMVASGFAYFTAPEMAENFTKLGFPSYFRIELGIAKILGALVLVIPVVPKLVKEWVYAGFTITFVSAFIAHLSIGDPLVVSIPPLVGLMIMMTSYFTNKVLE